MEISWKIILFIRDHKCFGILNVHSLFALTLLRNYSQKWGKQSF